MMNRFLGEFMSQSIRLDRPTEAMRPKSAMNMAPTMGVGRVAKTPPTCPKNETMIMLMAPIWTTYRLATRVRPIAPMFSE